MCFSLAESVKLGSFLYMNGAINEHSQVTSKTRRMHKTENVIDELFFCIKSIQITSAWRPFPCSWKHTIVGNRTVALPHVYILNSRTCDDLYLAKEAL